MEKKTKTPIQQKKTYKRLSNLCFGGEFVSVIAPFIGIGLANYEKYFIQYNGTKISIGFALAMAVMGVAVYLISKKQFTNTFITLFVAWGAVTGILFLVKELLSDLCYIMLFGWIGVGGACGLDKVKKNLNAKAEKIQKGIERAEEDEIVEEHKIDMEQKREKKNKPKNKVKF